MTVFSPDPGRTLPSSSSVSGLKMHIVRMGFVSSPSPTLVPLPSAWCKSSLVFSSDSAIVSRLGMELEFPSPPALLVALEGSLHLCQRHVAASATPFWTPRPPLSGIGGQGMER
ncbi:hypothetical protein Salat_2813600 [Sesamum alatum]|uniref:Uncharacterized protein n=1 Tax=Sesamum alatum TaxID=300844 RepID=A0AAE1XLE6_9LAMI|nr:hypothetical protein Salat_2813600 [Sesamum alatum]